MANIVDKLPFELSNIVYSYLGKSDTAAKMIEEYHFHKILDYDACRKCKFYHRNDDILEYLLETGRIRIPIKYEMALCEYCHAEELGEEVYTCCKCSIKTYYLGNFNNTEEDGLFCNNCYEFYLEESDEEDLEDLEESESEN